MNAVSVKLDENLGRSQAELLRQAGYVAERAHEEGLSGVDDAKLWKHICDEGRFFVTVADEHRTRIRRPP